MCSFRCNVWTGSRKEKGRDWKGLWVVYIFVTFQEAETGNNIGKSYAVWQIPYFFPFRREYEYGWGSDTHVFSMISIASFFLPLAGFLRFGGYVSPVFEFPRVYFYLLFSHSLEHPSWQHVSVAVMLNMSEKWVKNVFLTAALFLCCPHSLTFRRVISARNLLLPLSTSEPSTLGSTVDPQ